MISELQLLSGIPIDVESCKVHPLTLREIVLLGEQKYNSYLSSLMLKKANINKELINPEMWEEFLKMDEFEFMMVFMFQDEDIKNIILSSLSSFLKEKVEIDLVKGIFIKRDSGDFIITKDIFDQIKDVIFKQNFINDSAKKEEEDSNPYDDRARELIAKRNKFRKLIQEQNAQDGLNLADIISIVASLSPNYNFDNIWNLTVYHLYTVYTRMAIKDNYETQIYLLPHSSSDKSPEIKHWMSKINKNN